MSRIAQVFLIALLALAPTVAWAETDITTSNSSDDTHTESGDASATNSSAAQVGHQGGGETDVDAGDVSNDDATNVQEGDNTVDGSQTATSQSGSSVTGQVVGGNASGDMSIDATNSTTDSSAETGDATSDNDFAAFVGLDAASDTAVGADITNASAVNLQEGDNDASLTQRTDAVTGDAVAGQILGGSASGTLDIVAANTSEDTDATSGEADEDSSSEIFSGLAATGVIEI